MDHPAPPARGTGHLAAAPAGSAGRNGGIDALRAVVTLLVVFHHTALTYGAIGGWYYREIAPSATLSSRLLILFCMVNQAWFMGMFFLLAGCYTPTSFRHHGVGEFVRGRLVRLGIPIIVYALLLHPATVALAALARGRPFGGVFAYMWRHGRFEPGPLWFAEALLIFTAGWLVWRLVRGPSPPDRRWSFPSHAILFGSALATGLAAFGLRFVWPVGVNVGFLQLGYFATYVVLFAAGCGAAGNGWLDQVEARRVKPWVRLAWSALPVFPVVSLLAWNVPFLAGRSEGGWNLQALTYAVWEPFVAWGFILGLLSFFQRRFARLRGLWPGLARRAFLIYIIHPPILVGVAVAWRSFAWPALLKFAVTGSVACALCYLAAGLLLRVPGVARVV